ncbi:MULTISPECIES: antitoxin [Sinobaca]|uniref:CopG family transcriptional regulator/antitoxin EndoAI n=1 Tax=Sinobaca qinghaiensis TaxID=342944 RepID=A0A419V3V8_9BACL|nr:MULTISPECIES: antitoxin [Sinobaca]RKD73209.1 CopG family transcriptional regulator/antitoxin EndoAI [Sinobaca qinghaiensis]
MFERNTKQIKVSLPEYLLSELDGILDQGRENRDDFIHQATELYLRESQRIKARESMQKGYVEMAQINLHIASESFVAEAEAEHSMDTRLVSGV